MCQTPRSGQAAVEFAVALLAMLAGAIGILVVHSLVQADAQADDAARGRAAAAAASVAAAEGAFPELSDISPGSDGIPLTPDDVRIPGSVSSIRTGVTRRLLGDSFDADLRGDGSTLRHGQVPWFADGVPAALSFSLRKGVGEGVAELPPAALSLFGLPAEAVVREECWMPALDDLQ